MFEIYLYSPLEQFEFTLISGMTAEHSIFELLLGIDTEEAEISNLLEDEMYSRNPAVKRVEHMFNIVSAGLNERLYFSPQVYNELCNQLIAETLRTALYEGAEGARWYNHIGGFFITGHTIQILNFMYDVFPHVAYDHQRLFACSLCMMDEDITKLGIIFNTECDELALPLYKPIFGILVASTLTELYLPFYADGVNSSLTFLTTNFYSWVVDRILLNDLLTAEDFNVSLTDFLSNKSLGLSGLHMDKRDYTSFSFFWLNIYNSLFIVISLIILIFIVFNQGYSKVTNVWQTLNTLTFDFLVKSFISLANKRLLIFFPIFFCFFIFIFLLNLTALTPFSFCLTSNLWFSLSLSFSVWFGVTVLAIIVKGPEFFIGFVPKNIASNELKVFITIIEVISYVARALSLGVRIFANMLAGHSLVHILSDLTATCFVEFDNLGLKLFGIFPAIILSFILVIEFGICFLQGLVFVILTAIYLKEAFEGH